VRRRDFISLLGGATAWPLAARAQQAGSRYTVGTLTAGNDNAALNTVLVAALRELGWVEGKNVVFEHRYADNRLERLPGLAADLVRLKVDVIAAAGTLAPLAAKQASFTIPIVMTAAGDPLGSGLVASLARPDGNVTGMSLMAPDLGGKRLELLKEVLPRLDRVAVLWNAANPYPALVFKETQAAGQTLGIEVQSLEVRAPDDFDGAFEAARRQRPDALIRSKILSPLVIDSALRTSRPNNNCRRYMELENLRQPAGSCPMGRVSLTSFGVPPATLTRSSGVPSPLIFRCSSRPSSSW
jgi:putative ABC transport system substrate-binding protein